ncbi:NlpC/P60 family protein, partial [Pseudomonas syringae group genomosp. 7]
GVAHVGIYLGGGRMLDAQNNGVVVESLDWWNKYLVGYGRIAGVN